MTRTTSMAGPTSPRPICNDFSVTRLTRALDVIDNPNTPGVDPVCRSVVDGTDPNCVPYDIFATGQASRRRRSPICRPRASSAASTSRRIASASLTGDLGAVWPPVPVVRTSGVGIAFGVEYRKESLELQHRRRLPDRRSRRSGRADAPGLAARSTSARSSPRCVSRSSTTGFIYDLSLERRLSLLGLRASAAPTASVRHDTYKIEATSPRSATSASAAATTAPFARRTSRSCSRRSASRSTARAIRAPVLDGDRRPPAARSCAGDGRHRRAIGRIAANPAGQYNGLIGGNPTLDSGNRRHQDARRRASSRASSRGSRSRSTSSTSRSTMRSEHRPGRRSWMPAPITASIRPFCGLVRPRRVGLAVADRERLSSIDIDQNIGGARDPRYRRRRSATRTRLGGIGTLGFNFVGTWLDKLHHRPDRRSAPYDCVGFYGVDLRRADARVAAQGPPEPAPRRTGIGLLGQLALLLGASRSTRRATDPDARPARSRRSTQRIAAQNYFDLTLTARIGDHYNFRLGVNNILDREPPIIGSNGGNRVSTPARRGLLAATPSRRSMTRWAATSSPASRSTSKPSASRKD